MTRGLGSTTTEMARGSRHDEKDGGGRRSRCGLPVRYPSGGCVDKEAHSRRTKGKETERQDCTHWDHTGVNTDWFAF